jgi:hypothetical protein
MLPLEKFGIPHLQSNKVWIYNVNLRLCMCVEPKHYPKAPEVLRGTWFALMAEGTHVQGWKPFPELPKCQRCESTGRISIVCPCCRRLIVVDCKCPPLPLGEHYLDGHRAKLINLLPNVEWVHHDSQYGHSVVFFRFTGGIARCVL